MQWHDVIAATHYNVSMKTGTVVPTIDNTWWCFGDNDVLPVFRDQGLQNETLDDQMLPDMLDTFDKFTVTELSKIIKRVPFGKLLRCDRLLFHHDRDVLAKAALAFALGFTLLARLAALLFRTRFRLCRHRCPVYRSLIRIHSTAKLLFHRRKLL